MDERRRIRINIRIGTVLSYLTILVGMLVSFFYVPFLISKVGKTQHGIYNFVNSIISWMSFLTVGIAGSYVRFATKYNKERGEEGTGKINTAFIYILSAGALIGVILLVILLLFIQYGVIPLENYTADEKKLISSLFIIGIIHLAFYFATMFFNGFNVYKNNLILVRGIALGIAIITPILTIPFLMMGYDVTSVAIVKLAVDVVTLIIYVLFSFLSEKITFSKFANSRERNNLIKEILIFSFFVILYVTIDTITKSSEKIVLGFYGLPNLVSVFALGRSFLDYTFLAVAYVSANYIQVINEKIAGGKNEEVDNLFLRLSKVNLFILFFIYGGYLASGEAFINAWLGNSGFSEVELRQIFTIGAVLILANIVPFSQQSVVDIQRGFNKHKIPTLVLLVSAIVNFILMSIVINFIPSDYIVLGLLLSSAITTIISQVIIMNIYNKKELHLNIKKYFFNLLKMSLITAIPVIVCYVLFGLIFDLTQSLQPLYVFLIEGITFVIIFAVTFFIFERNFVSYHFKRIFKRTKRNSNSQL